jgi:hypothetical protein
MKCDSILIKGVHRKKDYFEKNEILHEEVMVKRFRDYLV